MEQGKEFYAFISYKREDEKWAKWLQGKLEHYKFPTNLNGETDLPKNIRPIFRDVTDLSPEPLERAINNALCNSEWLVVICSPRSAQSPWVCKEAQSFIDQGRADRIIPFVIEGTPFSNDIATECFPDALRSLTGSQELLAANIDEMGRDAATIKIIARMFNLRFDTLWQRHERQRRRRRNWIIVAVTAFVLAVMGIAGYIMKQSKEIKRKNWDIMAGQSRFLSEKAIQLADSNDIVNALRLCIELLPDNLLSPNRPYTPEAEYALRRISTQYGLTNNIIPLAQKHNTTNWIGTIKINTGSLNIYSVSFSSDNRHIAATSEIGLLEVYDINTGKCVFNDSIGYLDNGTAVFSPNGQLIATAGWGTVDLYHIGKNEHINIFSAEYPAHIDQGGTIKFSNDGNYLAFWPCCYDIFKVYDIRNYNKLKEIPNSIDYSVVFDISPDSKEIAVMNDDGNDSYLRFLDIHTGLCIDSVYIDNIDNYCLDLNYDNSGKYITIDLDVDAVNSSITVERKSLTVVRKKLNKDNNIGKSIFSKDSTYKAVVNRGEISILINKKSEKYSIDSSSILVISPDESSAIVVKQNSHKPYVYDIASGKFKFQLLGHNDTVSHVSYSSNGKYIATCSADSTIRIWDPQSGQCIKTLHVDAPIWCEFDNNTTQLLVVGEQSAFSFETDNWNTNWSILLENEPATVVYNNSYICLRDYESSTIHTINKNNGVKEELYLDCEMALVAAERIMAMNPYAPILYYISADFGTWGGSSELNIHNYLYNTDTVVSFESYRNYNYIDDISISRTGAFFALVSSSSNEINIFEAKNNKEVKTINIPIPNYLNEDYERKMKVEFDNNDEYIYFLENNDLYIFHIASGQLVEHIIGYNDFYISSQGNYMVLSRDGGVYTIIKRHTLQSLISKTKNVFKDNPLTPEERHKYFLD